MCGQSIETEGLVLRTLNSIHARHSLRRMLFPKQLNRPSVVDIEFKTSQGRFDQREGILSIVRILRRDLSGFWFAFVGFHVGKIWLPDKDQRSVVNKFGFKCRGCRVSVGVERL
jgi:hypothetical protein